MTREEEILEYANSFKGKGMEGEELKEIIRLAIIDGAKWADKHPIKPSLPSNLDEAAKEYGRNTFINKCMENGVCDGHDLSDAFNAGAELIAGQFQKIEGELVDWYSTSDGKDYCCGISTDEAFEVPEGFYIKKK